MQHVMSSSVSRRAQPAGRQTRTPPAPQDPRWQLLALVRTCRDKLALRDRDITVLRGLLSLVPAGATPVQRVVFASNRVLIERCDGIDERTLRRRLAQLQTAGLLIRKPSPNGKRYQIRDADTEARLTYGIDLTPLFALQSHLEGLAALCGQEALQRRSLRAMIRDLLFRHPDAGTPAEREEARLSLRRVLSIARLEAILRMLAPESPPTPAPQMTVSDSQNDRHIQRSDKEDLESEPAEKCQKPQPAPETQPDEDLTVEECLDLAPTARALAPEPLRSWDGMIDLSARLAPAIGLSPQIMQSARSALGPHGCALAVLGLIEALGRIRNPQAYLQALILRAGNQGLNSVRMFRSLVRPMAEAA